MRELRIFAAALKKDRAEQAPQAEIPSQWEHLGDRSLLELIAQFESEERSGLLAISDQHEHRGIFFDHGRIVATASSDESASLGQRLVRARWISEAERCKANETRMRSTMPSNTGGPDADSSIVSWSPSQPMSAVESPLLAPLVH